MEAFTEPVVRSDQAAGPINKRVTRILELLPEFHWYAMCPDKGRTRLSIPRGHHDTHTSILKRLADALIMDKTSNRIEGAIMMGTGQGDGLLGRAFDALAKAIDTGRVYVEHAPIVTKRREKENRRETLRLRLMEDGLSPSSPQAS